MFPMPRDPLDAAVRAHLESDGNASAGRVLAAVLGALEEKPRRRQHSRRAFLMPLAAAAALIIALFAVSPRGSVQASPAEVVREAQKIHEDGEDRCYILTAEPAESLSRRLPKLDCRREARLWTRGHRFWVETGLRERRWTWGRDGNGTVWIAASSSSGLRFAADELPEPLALFVEVRAVRLPNLLGDVLQGCDLTFADGVSPDVQVIRAVPKPGQKTGTLAEARLEIDARTHAVRKLVLHRRFMGQDLGTVTLTLVMTGSQPDTLYTLEGHLKPGAAVLGRANAVQRNLVLLRLLER
jgi:hypothetical protein